MSEPTNPQANEPTNDPTTDEAGSTMDGTDTTSTTTYDATPEPTPGSTPDSTPGSTAGSTGGEVPSGRHPVNIGHLVMGLAFAGLVVIWALIEADVIADRDIRWLLPIPWVLAGTAGLLAVTLGNRSRRNP
jgi:hypothetical protein